MLKFVKWSITNTIEGTSVILLHPHYQVHANKKIAKIDNFGGYNSN